LFFIEKISHSDGPNKILRSSGNTRYIITPYLFRLLNGESLNLLDIFKMAFPEYFRIEEHKKEEFLDIISNVDY
jgi:hypothetical protein